MVAGAVRLRAVSQTYGQLCPVAGALDAVGGRWTILLLRDLLWHGPQRFSELEHNNPGLSTSLLARRLRELTAAGLIEPVGVPSTGHYRLTASGERIRMVIEALYQFGGPFLMEGRWTEEMLDYFLASAARRRRADLLRLKRTASVRLSIQSLDSTVSVGPGRLGRSAAAATDGSLSCSQSTFLGLVTGATTLAEAVGAGAAEVSGDEEAVALVTGLLTSTTTVDA